VVVVAVVVVVSVTEVVVVAVAVVVVTVVQSSEAMYVSKALLTTNSICENCDAPMPKRSDGRAGQN
jgi:hypothetical protein